MTDTALLQRFVADRSAEAFHTIVQRYAGLVFGVAFRVTADRAAAEDVAQDCFFTLSQKADQVRESLPGWLHRVALNRAHEMGRSEAARRAREQALATDADAAASVDTDELTWSDLSPLVDEALASLPEELRAPVVEHFLCGRSQRDVGEQLAVNQGTVSRRIERGIGLIRDHLRSRGVVVPSVGVLAGLMAANGVEAAPPALVAALGKMALASQATAAGAAISGAAASGTSASGAACAAAAPATASAGLGAAKLAAAVVVAAGLTAGGIIVSQQIDHAPTPSGSQTMSVATRRPAVRREGGRVWVEGVRRLDGSTWRGPEMDMIAAAAEPVAGRDLYDQLMAMSGMAYRVQTLPRETWCPSAALARFGVGGIDQLSAAADAAGVTFTIHEPGEGADAAAQLDALITQHIDAGKPIAAQGPWWLGVIAGYERVDAGPLKLLIVNYDHSPDAPLVTDGRPTRLLILESEQPTLTIDTAHAAAAGMRLAARLADLRPGDPAAGEYLAGPEAFVAWSAMLRQDDTSDAFAAAKQAHSGDGGVAECHRRNLAWLAASRASAAALLRDAASELDAPLAAAARTAADHYLRCSDTLDAARHNQQWTPAGRAELADAIDAASVEDGKAIDAIRVGLAAGLAPRFVDRPAFRVLGVEDDHDTLEREDPGFERLWFDRFTPHSEHVQRFNDDGVHYNVTTLDATSPQAPHPDRFMAGMAASEDATVPESDDNWLIREVPAAHYAVFDTTVGDIGETWEDVIHAWLPQSGYRVDVQACLLDHHPAGTANQQSPMTIWLPVKPSAIRDGERVVLSQRYDSPSLEVNGYVRGIEALLRARGESISYERLMGLSGMAFAMQVNTEHRWEGVVDAGWWPLDPIGVDARLGFLSRAVGYEFVVRGRPLYIRGWQERTPKLPALYGRDIKPLLEATIDAGQPALTGWCATNQEMGYVIYGYENGGDGSPIVGICARSPEGDGEVGRCPDWPYGVLVLGERATPMDPRAVDIAALRYAVRLARSEVVLDPGSPWTTGAKSYAFWASLLRNPDEPVRSFHHGNVKQHLVWSRTAAVAYLHDVASREAGPANGTLRQAAATYQQIIDRAEQMKTGGVDRDQSRRNALADEVEALASLELEAANQMEQAVMQMALKREDDTVQIDLDLGFNTNQFASSVHGSQARILETLGEPLTYEDLICYGGFAFRANWHNACCPSAGHPCCGYGCMDGSNAAIPWKAQMFAAFPDTKKRNEQEREAFEAEACAAIKNSIDRGIPVHYGSEEDGLIVGYADEGRRWLCVHPYYKNGAETFWYDQVEPEGIEAMAAGKWPWAVVAWQEPLPASERTSEHDLLVAALKQAVDMWQTEMRGDYYCGDAAYEHWLQWLRDVEAGKAEDPKAGMQGNGWCMDVLVHSRRIAGPWLRKRAEEHDGEAKAQLLVAAECYDQLVADCLSDVNSTWDLTLGPGGYDQWTSELRQRQIARLEAAREHDRAAIAAMEKALAAME